MKTPRQKASHARQDQYLLGEQIVAVPTLVKLPLQRLVGDMSGLGTVLFGLDLKVRES